MQSKYRIIYRHPSLANLGCPELKCGFVAIEKRVDGPCLQLASELGSLNHEFYLVLIGKSHFFSCLSVADVMSLVEPDECNRRYPGVILPKNLLYTALNWQKLHLIEYSVAAQ